MAATSSPFFSPSSEKRFWTTTLQSRVDDIRENRKHLHSSSSTKPWEGGLDGTKRFKEDSMLLRRGFDSVAFCLSQFSSNIDHALQGARELGKPPTLIEILQSKNSEEETDTKKVVQSERARRGCRGRKKGSEEKGWAS
ncbi:hypothetical protein Dimus_015839 [Dionaea muscipula]